MTANLEGIFENNRYYVLGISNNDGVSSCQLISVLFKNAEFNIEERFFLNDKNLLHDYLVRDYPIILHIEGDNIINKIVEKEVGYKGNIVFKANPNEFYFFEYHQKSKIFVSVVRKGIIDDFCKLLNKKNRYITHLSFGPFVMSNLLPITKDYSEISSSNYTLEISSDEVLSFKNKRISQKEYFINGDTLNQNELPLLAAFLNYKFPNKSIEFDTHFLSSNREEFKFKKWFKVAGVFTLVFYLLSLFISSTLYKSYSNSLAEKESIYNISKQTIAKVSALKEEKTLKERILQKSNINNKSYISKYLLDIGNSVPNDIKLKTINVIPIIKKVKPIEEINFDFGIINISGETSNDSSFNSWIKNIEAIPWINKVDINYSQENKTINMFVIKIKI